MQRVRIGLTGLAFVFLAVLLAAIFTRRTADEPPITPNTIEQGTAGAPSAGAPAAAAPQQAEPLAKMGLAPGDANAAEPQSAPPSGNAEPVNER